MLASDYQDSLLGQQQILSEVAAQPASGLEEGFEECRAGARGLWQEEENEERKGRNGVELPVRRPSMKAGDQQTNQVSQKQLQVGRATQPASEGYRLGECRAGAGSMAQVETNVERNQREVEILPWSGRQPLGERNSRGSGTREGYRPEWESAGITGQFYDMDRIWEPEDANTGIFDRPPSKGEQEMGCGRGAERRGSFVSPEAGARDAVEDWQLDDSNDGLFEQQADRGRTDGSHYGGAERERNAAHMLVASGTQPHAQLELNQTPTWDASGRTIEESTKGEVQLDDGSQRQLEGGQSVGEQWQAEQQTSAKQKRNAGQQSCGEQQVRAEQWLDGQGQLQAEQLALHLLESQRGQLPVEAAQQRFNMSGYERVPTL